MRRFPEFLERAKTLCHPETPISRMSEHPQTFVRTKIPTALFLEHPQIFCRTRKTPIPEFLECLYHRQNLCMLANTSSRIFGTFTEFLYHRNKVTAYSKTTGQSTEILYESKHLFQNFWNEHRKRSRRRFLGHLICCKVQLFPNNETT
jgi:hypothetical protein